MDSYLTIGHISEGQYKEKGSKFLAFAVPVETEEKAKAAVEELKKVYHDARHHCYAYVIGNSREYFRVSDDGEPGHSAGDPILGQIRSLELTNIIIVVVRYFGGTKLGVGGLINAYRSAAKAALDQNTIITKQITKCITINYPYDSTAVLMKLVNDQDLKIVNQSFTANCQLEVAVKASRAEKLLAQLKLLVELGHDIRFSNC